MTSSPSSSPEDCSPALNGAEAPPPSTSASGKITSAAMPSLSSSASRVVGSYEASFPPSPVSSSQSSRNFACSSDAASRITELQGQLGLEVAVERLAVLRVDVVAVRLAGRAGVGVGRDDEVAVHGGSDQIPATVDVGLLAVDDRLGSGRGPRVHVAVGEDPEAVGEHAVDGPGRHLLERHDGISRPCEP
jgi:hypothetical protein